MMSLPLSSRFNSLKDSLLLAAAIATLILAPYSVAQTGTVAIYSASFPAKDQAKVLLSPKSHAPYLGAVFDGDIKLASLSAGHFLALNVSAGQHNFTIKDQGRYATQSSVSVNVQPGQLYCLRTKISTVNVYVIPTISPRKSIEEVNCQQALQESLNSRPVEMKRIEVTIRSQVDPTTSFPQPKPGSETKAPETNVSH